MIALLKTDQQHIPVSDGSGWRSFNGYTRLANPLQNYFHSLTLCQATLSKRLTIPENGCMNTACSTTNDQID